MPQNQALQVFYGTLPLILVLIGIWARENMLLKSILARLSSVEKKVEDVKDGLSRNTERLVVLESRSGYI